MREVLEKWTVPVRLDVMREREAAKRWGVYWSPTILYMDPAGEGRVLHRWLGYLPPEDFAAQTLVGAGLANYQLGRMEKAMACFTEAVERFPRAEAAPEAIYWQAVCAFRRAKGGNAIYQACLRIVDTYPGTLWAKKLSFTRKYKDFSSVGK